MKLPENVPLQSKAWDIPACMNGEIVPRRKTHLINNRSELNNL